MELYFFGKQGVGIRPMPELARQKSDGADTRSPMLERRLARALEAELGSVAGVGAWEGRGG